MIQDPVITGNARTAAGTADLAIPVPAGVNIGGYTLAICHTNATTSQDVVTPAEFNSLGSSLAGTNHRMFAFGKPSVAESGDYLFNTSASLMLSVIIAYYPGALGLDGSIVADSEGGVSDSTFPGPSVPATVAGRMVCAYGANAAPSHSLTPATDHALRNSIGGSGIARRIYLTDRILAAPGATGTADAVHTANSIHPMISLVLAPVPEQSTTYRITPDAILQMTNLSGILGNIQDDPDSPDSNWLVAP